MKNECILLFLALMLAGVGCSKEIDGGQENPSGSGGNYVSFKAEIQQDEDTKLWIEPIQDKDAFKITGWESGDIIFCSYTLDGSTIKSVHFQYDILSDTFSARMPEGMSMADLGPCFHRGGVEVYRYIDGAYILDYFWDPNVTDKRALCSLMGSLKKKEGTKDEYVATMTAEYALACIHNQTNEAETFVMAVKNGSGIKYMSKVYGRYASATDYGVYYNTDVLENALREVVPANGKYYVMLPKPMPGDEICVCHLSGDKIQPVCAYKNTVELGKVYRVVYNGISDNENSYIINDFNTPLLIKADKKGHNGGELGEWKTAEVLWETFGTTTKPNKGDVIKMSYDAQSKSIFVRGVNNGNATVAVKDASGKILWSWHIWVCKDFKPEESCHTYKFGNKKVMDRNLGATIAGPAKLPAGEDKCKWQGLLYQWGRKDPFMGAAHLEGSSEVAHSEGIGFSSVSSDAEHGTIQYSIEHPTTFIGTNSNNQDWYYTGSRATDATRWRPSNNEKGIYDPCPKGWRVPDGGMSGLWGNAFRGELGWLNDGPFDDGNYGLNFGKNNGKEFSRWLSEVDNDVWYPISGVLDVNKGELGGILLGYLTNYWSASSYIDGEGLSRAYVLNISKSIDRQIGWNTGIWHGGACAVRCVKDE